MNFNKKKKPTKEKSAAMLAKIEMVKAEWKEYYEKGKIEGKKFGNSGMHPRDDYKHAP